MHDGQAEVIEAEVSDTTKMANKALSALGLPKGVLIGALIRNGSSLDLTPDTVIKPGDRVITLATQGQARKIEKMFTVQVDLF